MPASMTNSCVVCSKLKSSYKCPKCRSCYCSLQCNKVHKSVCSAVSGTVQSEVSERNDKTFTNLTQTTSSIAPIGNAENGTTLADQASSETVKTTAAVIASAASTEEATSPLDQPNIAEIKAIQTSKITSTSDEIDKTTINKIVEMFSGYDDSDAESDKESPIISEDTKQLTKQSDNIEEIMIDDIPTPEIAPNTEIASSSSSTRRINHNIDSNDMNILSSETVQTLLKSEWARNVLKSSRLRDDILSVDSSQNRQGVSLLQHVSIVTCKFFIYYDCFTGNVIILFFKHDRKNVFYRATASNSNIILFHVFSA